MNVSAVCRVLYLGRLSAARIEVADDAANIADVAESSFIAAACADCRLLREAAGGTCAGRHNVAAVVLRRIDDAVPRQIADDAADVVRACDVVFGVLCVFNADVIREAERRLGASNGQCLMVGDRRDDMEGARNCGLPAAGVLYGYGTRQELEPYAPAFLAPDCESLTKFILES